MRFFYLLSRDFLIKYINYQLKRYYYKLTANVNESLDGISLSNTFYSQYTEEREKATQEYLSAIQSIHDITLKEELMREIYEKENL